MSPPGRLSTFLQRGLEHVFTDNIALAQGAQGKRCFISRAAKAILDIQSKFISGQGASVSHSMGQAVDNSAVALLQPCREGRKRAGRRPVLNEEPFVLKPFSTVTGYGRKALKEEG